MAGAAVAQSEPRPPAAARLPGGTQAPGWPGSPLTRCPGPTAGLGESRAEQAAPQAQWPRSGAPALSSVTPPGQWGQWGSSRPQQTGRTWAGHSGLSLERPTQQSQAPRRPRSGTHVLHGPPVPRLGPTASESSGSPPLEPGRLPWNRGAPAFGHSGGVVPLPPCLDAAQGHGHGPLSPQDAGHGGAGLPAPGLVRLAERLLPLRRPHPAVGVLRVQVPAEPTR